jgi:hypothetical protein
MQELFSIAKQTHTPIAELANSFNNLASGSGGYFKSNRELLTFLENTQKLMSLDRLSASTRESIMDNLSQMMITGSKRGLGQIARNAPSLYREIQDAIGKDNLKSGSFGALDIINALMQVDTRTADELNKTVTFANNATDAMTNLKEMVVPLEEELSVSAEGIGVY